MADRLYRSETDKVLGGVCGGLAQHFDLDPSLVRIITVVLIFSGLSPIFYLIAWLIIPTESQVKDTANETETNSKESKEGKTEETEE